MLKTLEKVQEYLNENKLVLSGDKNGIYFLRLENNLEKIIYREETVPAKEHARYLDVLVDENLTFSAELNKYLSKMAVVVKSIYCARHMVPLETKSLFFRPLVLSHLSFSSVFFQKLPMSQFDR